MIRKLPSLYPDDLFKDGSSPQTGGVSKEVYDARGRNLPLKATPIEEEVSRPTPPSRDEQIVRARQLLGDQNAARAIPRPVQSQPRPQPPESPQRIVADSSFGRVPTRGPMARHDLRRRPVAPIQPAQAPRLQQTPPPVQTPPTPPPVRQVVQPKPVPRPQIHQPVTPPSQSRVVPSPVLHAEQEEEALPRRPLPDTGFVTAPPVPSRLPPVKVLVALGIVVLVAALAYGAYLFFFASDAPQENPSAPQKPSDEIFPIGDDSVYIDSEHDYSFTVPETYEKSFSDDEGVIFTQKTSKDEIFHTVSTNDNVEKRLFESGDIYERTDVGTYVVFERAVVPGEQPVYVYSAYVVFEDVVLLFGTNGESLSRSSLELLRDSVFSIQKDGVPLIAKPQFDKIVTIASARDFTDLYKNATHNFSLSIPEGHIARQEDRSVTVMEPEASTSLFEFAIFPKEGGELYDIYGTSDNIELSRLFRKTSFSEKDVALGYTHYVQTARGDAVFIESLSEIATEELQGNEVYNVTLETESSILHFSAFVSNTLTLDRVRDIIFGITIDGTTLPKAKLPELYKPFLEHLDSSYTQLP